MNELMDDPGTQPGKIELVISEDGSHTLYVPQLDEHYHSTHGAIQESRHIFIEAGLSKAAEEWNEINLLEVGFGTGLNALLTYLKTIHNNLQVNYNAIEAYPLNEDIFNQLNYGHLLEEPEASACFYEICLSEWNQPVRFTPNFKLTKVICLLQEFAFDRGPYNLVYFDAFSPEAQPEMWTEDIFRKLYNKMNPGGLLVTYSCKGSVKRAMKSAGFAIEKLAGPPGKREILRAIKPSK